MRLATVNGRRNRQSMGVAPLLAAGASLYQADQQKKQQEKSGGGGRQAAPTGGRTSGIPGSEATTISPTFQQSFTPQISPIMTVSTGSGAVTASTAQTATGGQQAEGGGTRPADPYGRAPARPAASPYARPYPSSTDQPYTLPSAFDFEIKRDWMMPALGLLGLGVGVYLWQNR